jgi:hypothetical protein
LGLHKEHPKIPDNKEKVVRTHYPDTIFGFNPDARQAMVRRHFVTVEA